VFGKYDLSFEISEADVTLSMTGEGRHRRYRRRCGSDETELMVSATRGNVVVCPVEPVNMPDPQVTEHLQIELETPFIIQPGGRDTIFLKFPVEVGVFLVDKKDIERIDLFTKTPLKYTLYGPPESGIVCKWWKSPVLTEQPDVEKLYEGVMRVDIRNHYHEWVEIRKLVFCGVEMKIFYGDYAYMHGFLSINKKSFGDTGFIAKKPPDMHGSLDIYLAKGLKRLENFVMEEGYK
jgi:hypothetical protein